MATVFFDLDDTLFDHRWSARSAIAAIAERWRLAAPIDQLETEYHRQLAELHPQVMAGRIGPDSARRRRFGALFTCSGSAPPEPFAEVLATAGDAYRASRRCVPGARGVIDALRPHHRLGIISNNFRSEQVEKLRVIGLADLIDGLVVSEDVGVMKPDPAIFSAALQRAGARAEESLMVGDNWDADIAGARGMGMRALWFARHAEAVAADPAVPLLRSFERVEVAVAAIAAALSLRW